MLSERLFTYDFLRLLAIVLVIFAHILHGEVAFGFNGIVIFLIMSGYLLTSSEKPLSRDSIIPYLRKRFIRIFPLYWIALILFLCVSYLLANNTYNWPTIIANLVGIQAVIYPKYIDEIIFYWFVSLIMVYYLIYPLITRGKKIYSILLISILIFIFFVLIRIFTGLFEGRIFEYYFPFVFGIIASRLQFFDADKYLMWKKISVVVAVICIAIGIIYKPTMPEDLSQINMGVLFTVGMVTIFRTISGTCITIALCWAFSRLKWPSFVTSIITRGAIATYAVYLFQSSYYLLINRIINYNDDAIRIVISILALPILFVICYYIQITTDKLFAARRNHKPSRA